MDRTDIQQVRPESDRPSGPTQGDFTDAHWEPRIGVAQGVAVLVRGGPVTLSIAAGLIAARALPHPAGFGWALWTIAMVGASQLALAIGERGAQRLLPLSTMLRYSLAFPDKAPSRFGAALRSGNVEKLRRDVEKTMKHGLPVDLQEAVETGLAMVAALNKHDRGTRGHSERVRAFSELLAEEMGLDRVARDRLRWGALLHDMGKLAVPAEILNKNGKPTPEEWAILARHPAEGERMLASLADWLGDAVHCAGQHHERWDGKGYPNGIAGTDISLSARIVAVADAFAVMTAARAYKKALPMELARHELTKNAGTQFDPTVVRAMLRVSVGKMSKKAGFLAPLANLPFIGSLLSSAPSIPTMVTSGATAIAVTASLAVPASPLEWANPIPANYSEPPTVLALTADAERTEDDAAGERTPQTKQLVFNDSPNSGRYRFAQPPSPSTTALPSFNRVRSAPVGRTSDRDTAAALAGNGLSNSTGANGPDPVGSNSGTGSSDSAVYPNAPTTTLIGTLSFFGADQTSSFNVPAVTGVASPAPTTTLAEIVFSQPVPASARAVPTSSTTSSIVLRLTTTTPGRAVATTKQSNVSTTTTPLTTTTITNAPLATTPLVTTPPTTTKAPTTTSTTKAPFTTTKAPTTTKAVTTIVATTTSAATPATSPAPTIAPVASSTTAPTKVRRKTTTRLPPTMPPLPPTTNVPAPPSPGGSIPPTIAPATVPSTASPTTTLPPTTTATTLTSTTSTTGTTSTTTTTTAPPTTLPPTTTLTTTQSPVDPTTVPPTPAPTTPPVVKGKGKGKNKP